MFITLYKMVLTSESAGEILSIVWPFIINKASEQCFTVVQQFFRANAKVTKSWLP